MKRTFADSETVLSPAAKKLKGNPHSHSHAMSYNAPYEPEAQSANDRFAGSIYKGRTLVDKTPQKIKFDDDAVSPAQDQAQLKALARKKSVTFTPETKNEDGATGQTFAKLWLLGTPPIQDQQQAPPHAPSPAQATPTKTPSLPPDKATSKQMPTKKAKKGKSQANDHDERIACIKYLEQFHKDKSNWKFNKSRQNDILRHIWSTEQIPVTSNDALVAYVAGLQGAASQQRLIEGALALLDPLLEKHKDSIDKPAADAADALEARRQAYQAAVEQETSARQDTEESTADEDSLDAVLRAKRLLLEALWPHIGASQPNLGAVPKHLNLELSASTASSDFRKKSRKSRTAAISDSDSSSSESESEDDGDSESSDSSDTSDSSSESDSDSD